MLARFIKLPNMANSSLANLVGTTPPNIVTMPLEDIENSLANGTVDVGMCGLFVTQARLNRFDFTNPFYFATGLQAAIKLQSHEPSADFIVVSLVNCIDGKTLLILILLLISVIVFGHLMSLTDVWLHDHPIFRKSYFEAVQDGIWMSFIMLSTIGFGDIVPKSSCARVLAVIWMFISIGLMAIIYAIMTSNFGAMNLQAFGDLDQIQGPGDLAPYSVGSTLTPNNPEFRSRFISSKFRTFATYEDMFSALLNGTIQVVVDRPEIINYYNTMDTPFQAQMVPVGALFNADGTGFGVRRINEYTHHPLLNLLSLAVADATRTNWQSESTTRLYWFGQAVAVTVDQGTLDEMSSLGYQSVLQLLEYVLAGAFGVWVVVSFIEFARRYPSYKARNDVCAVVRHCLGLAPHGSLKDKAVTASMRRDQIRMGLAQLARATRSKTEIQGKLDSALATPRPAGEEPRVSREGLRRISMEDGEPGEAEFDLDHFSAHVGEAMGREQRKGSGSVLKSTGRLFLGRCWEWISARDYRRHGAGLVRGLFLNSYQTVVDHSDSFGEANTICEQHVAEDVILHMLAQEERHWFREGSLMFAYRSSDGAADSDREFHQLLRVVHTVLEKQQGVLDLAAAARAAEQDTDGPSGPLEPTLGKGDGGSLWANGASARQRTQTTQTEPLATNSLNGGSGVSSRNGSRRNFTMRDGPAAAGTALPETKFPANGAAQLRAASGASVTSAASGASLNGDGDWAARLSEELGGRKGGVVESDKNMIRSMYPAGFPAAIPGGPTSGYNYSLKAPVNYSSLSALDILSESPVGSPGRAPGARKAAGAVRSPRQYGEKGDGKGL